MPGNVSDRALIDSIQARYGSAIFDGVQVIRNTYYSFQTYPTAGSTSFSFFGDVVGQNGVTKFQTNMKRANSFSQRMFLIKTIRTLFTLPSSTLTAANLSYDDTMLSLLNNIAANGAHVFAFQIQDKEYLQVTNPLLYFPFGSGVIASTPKVEQAVAADQATSYGVISPRKDDIFMMDPPQLLESEVTFNMNIDFQTAIPVPVAGRIGMIIDGLEFRPIQ